MLEWDRTWTPDFEGDGWAHGGIAVAPSAELVVTHPDGGVLLVLDKAGNRVRSIPTTAIEAHGLTISVVRARPAIWIADTGWKLTVVDGQKSGFGADHGKVSAIDLASGQTLMELDPPFHPLYRTRPYRPTNVAIDDGPGGSGDIWVADGYGASLLHRYSASGAYVGSLDGEDGAGRFDCPHGIYIDRRGASPRLYVSDRVPHRIQVFDLDGRFLRSLGANFLTSPSGFAAIDHRLVVLELQARLVVLDEDDRVETVVGADQDALDRPGWPNDTDAEGNLRRPNQFVAGRTNSPHGIAADAGGNLFLTEFVLGGRLSRLRVANSVAAPSLRA